MHGKTTGHRPTGGFTLIEMMTVLVIIGILTSLALPAIREHFLQAHLQEAQPYLMAIAARERIYNTQNGAYFAATNEVTLQQTLGVTLRDAANFCFIVRSNGFISGNAPVPDFEIWAILDDGDGTPNVNGVNCTRDPDKLAATGWVANNQLDNRVVLLRYPPPNTPQENANINGDDIFLDWVDGISTSHPFQ